jgi:hypothetical protein
MGAHRTRQDTHPIAVDLAIAVLGAGLILRTAASIHGTPGFLTAAAAFLVWPWAVHPLGRRISALQPWLQQRRPQQTAHLQEASPSSASAPARQLVQPASPTLWTPQS